VLARRCRLKASEENEAAGSLSDTLAAIAESYGINLVADAYRTERSDLAALPVGEALPLHEVLDRLVTPHAGWRREGEFFVARRHGWYHLRQREIPDAVARHWAAALRRAGGFTLEEAARLVASLRDEQLPEFEKRMHEAGLLVDLRFDGDDATARSQRAFLRAYGSLLPAQRRQLAGGGSLALAALPTRALQWLQSALTSGGHDATAGSRHGATPPGTLTLAAPDPSEEVISEARICCRTGMERAEELRIPLPRVAPVHDP
jgi:hypothetical protein